MASDPWNTPAMRQFRQFKAEQPGCVLFFRMGDFYELFGEDAERVAPVLGLAVTSRGNSIAVAGVPHHQRDRYLQRAIDAGFRVAVCDQIQDPKDAKGVVDRAVTQVITPGTLVDEALLADGATIALAAAHVRGDEDDRRVELAIVELSTGAFTLSSACDAEAVSDELARHGVRELLHANGDDDAVPALIAGPADRLGIAMTPRPAWQFHQSDAPALVREQYAVASLEGFGLRDDDPALAAAGAVIAYLRETQSVGKATSEATSGSEFQRLRSTLNHLRPPRREEASGVCVLDAVSLRALEVERTIRSDRERGSGVAGSLLGVFTESSSGPRCVMRTAMGKRLIRRWLCRPLSSADAIRARQSAVATLISDRRMADELAELLSGVQDAERIAARVALGRPTPRDLAALGKSLGVLREIAAVTERAEPLAGLRRRLLDVQDELVPLAEEVARTCVDEPPAHLRQGGLFRDGIDEVLDEARGLQRDAGAWLARYQAKLIEQHDLPSLRVSFNKVFGYYIELPAAQAKRAPDAFTRKQTLKNVERFITPELKTFEDRILTADERAIRRERELFAELVERVGKAVHAIGMFADAVAELDVLSGLAEKAWRRGWVRPEVTDEAVLVVRQGRHPVLDELLAERFVPNDVELAGALSGKSSPGLCLITGPNMAGKSTYIRQCALLALMASIGSFIPAESAIVGTCDRIFTRVGADDALHRGQSTFMVEMTETAAILNNATPRSLVILDEIGRGTSTLDGLSLAWAVVEHLAGSGGPAGPRTLFATHYHELTELEGKLEERVRNAHVTVREWGEEIVFLHRIKPGRAAGSYGVHVARLAGVPESVTARAEEVLKSLSVQEAGKVDAARVSSQAASRGQLGLFTEYVHHPAVDALREVKIETISPMQAFEELRRLHELAGNGSASITRG